MSYYQLDNGYICIPEACNCLYMYDKSCVYTVILLFFFICLTILAVEKQELLHILRVCL